MYSNPGYLKKLREDYPPGTRIQLNEMQDAFSNVPSGTMGTIDIIDDAGTLHVKWDNGSRLGLVPGVDSFGKIEPVKLKLYMPLSCELYETEEWGSFSKEPDCLNGRGAREYTGKIHAAIESYRTPEEEQRGLMHWYGKKDSVNEKVMHSVFTVEERDNTLWGVAECLISGKLSNIELNVLKDYLTGQAADGWGEGFEQQCIKIPEGELYVHLWDDDNSWQIMTEEELVHRYEQDQSPQMNGY